jgi:hypothetical protein
MSLFSIMATAARLFGHKRVSQQGAAKRACRLLPFAHIESIFDLRHCNDLISPELPLSLFSYPSEEVGDGLMLSLDDLLSCVFTPYQC